MEVVQVVLEQRVLDLETVLKESRDRREQMRFGASRQEVILVGVNLLLEGHVLAHELLGENHAVAEVNVAIGHAVGQEDVFALRAGRSAQ